MAYSLIVNVSADTITVISLKNRKGIVRFFKDVNKTGLNGILNLLYTNFRLTNGVYVFDIEFPIFELFKKFVGSLKNVNKDIIVEIKLWTEIFLIIYDDILNYELRRANQRRKNISYQRQWI